MRRLHAEAVQSLAARTAPAQTSLGAVTEIVNGLVERATRGVRPYGPLGALLTDGHSSQWRLTGEPRQPAPACCNGLDMEPPGPRLVGAEGAR